jgi:hypothetical protein
MTVLVDLFIISFSITGPRVTCIGSITDRGQICVTERYVNTVTTRSLYMTPSYLSKSKAIHLEAWSGPEGSRKLRFPDFMTTAQDGGKFVSLKHRPPLSPGNTPGTHFC